MKFEYAKGATPIDPDEADGLIPTHITFQIELNEWEQQNIFDAVKKHYSKKYSPDKILDMYFILDLHKDMFNQTWKWAGQRRKTLKNIGVLPEEIPAELKKMIDDVKFWIENKSYAYEEVCVRFHWRLVWIHIFANGNGRHARLATELLCKSLNFPPFSWGSNDLYSEGEARTLYINALKEADNNNFVPLINFVKT